MELKCVGKGCEAASIGASIGPGGIEILPPVHGQRVRRQASIGPGGIEIIGQLTQVHDQYVLQSDRVELKYEQQEGRITYRKRFNRTGWN